MPITYPTYPEYQESRNPNVSAETRDARLKRTAVAGSPCSLNLLSIP